MELTTVHRESLLTALEEAKDALRVAKTLVDKHGEDFEVIHFLALKRIELIKQSLIDNNIDY